MIDLTLLRENPERIIAALSKKDPQYDIAQLIELDKIAGGVSDELKPYVMQSGLDLLKEKGLGVH